MRESFTHRWIRQLADWEFHMATEKQNYKHMKRENELFAPQIDSVISNLSPEMDLMCSSIYLMLKEIYELFSCVKPIGDDDVRHIWIEAERGPLEAFGDYEEYKECGEVESPDDFEQLWKAYYPAKAKWYQFQTARYKDNLYFYFDGKLIYSIDINSEIPDSKPGLNLEYIQRFIEWLLERINDETEKLKNDIFSYNLYILQNLPFTKRFGRIRRQDFWDILGEESFRPDIALGQDSIEKLKQALIWIKDKESTLLHEMTANGFYKICEICYDANGYFKDQNKTLSSREKYLSMADGRDAGLRDIAADSPMAFSEWFHSDCVQGAHPWEICRGGNSTHISLFVSPKDGKWSIRLAGSGISRVEETVRMAVALYENNIPFELSDAEEIVNMISGTDFIGIVPDTIVPRYCHSMFPKDDRIIDFMNLDSDESTQHAIIGKTYWYPLEKIEHNCKTI